MPKMTKVKLQLNLDIGMYIFFERGMRGGDSYIFNRYSKDNYKYLKFFDPKKE